MITDFKRSETNPGALINKDISALQAYKKQREFMRKFFTFDERINKIEEKIDYILKKLEEINDS